MSRQKKKRTYTEAEYWKPFADVLAAILLTVLLFTIVLLLYFNNNSKTNDKTNDNKHDNTSVVHRTTAVPTTTQPPTTVIKHGSGETTVEVETGDEDRAKTAVKVRLVDQKTKRYIKKKSVKFELYTKGGSRRSLSTYYPVKKLYDVYETDDEGKFYLPEKIETGKYYLKQISDVKGYDRNEKSVFNVKRVYDWGNAYLVKVKLGTSKNRIFITQLDGESSDRVKFGKYQVLAAEDIETLDGTLRYSAGQVVDTITIDNKGQGYSKKLFLGKYQIKQVIAPSYYAALDKPAEVNVKSVAKVGNRIKKDVSISKTKYIVNVVDENDNSIKIEKAVLNVVDTKTNEEKQYSTDDSGTVILDNLKKGTTYEITQISSAEGYKFESAKHTFTVDKLGRINKKSKDSLNITNRMIRVTVDVKDRLVDFDLGNYVITLKNSSGKIIDEWKSDEKGHMISGIEEGNYQVVVSGPKEQVKKISVKDIAATQSFTVSVWTWLDVGIIIAGLLVVVALIIILLKMRKRISTNWKNKRNESKKRKEMKKNLENKE